MKRLTKLGVNVHKYNIIIYIMNILLYNKLIGMSVKLDVYLILHSICAIYSMYCLIMYSDYFNIDK